MVNPPRFTPQDFDPPEKRLAAAASNKGNNTVEADKQRNDAVNLAKTKKGAELESIALSDGVAFGAMDFEFHPEDHFQKSVLDFLVRPREKPTMKNQFATDDKYIDSFYQSGSISPDINGYDDLVNERLLKLFAVFNHGIANLENGFLEEEGIDKKFFAQLVLGSLKYHPQFLVSYLHAEEHEDLDAFRNLISFDPKAREKVLNGIFLQEARDNQSFEYGPLVSNLIYVFGDSIEEDFKERFVEAQSMQQEKFSALLAKYEELANLDEPSFSHNAEFEYSSRPAHFDEIDEVVRGLEAYDEYYESCLRFYTHFLFSKPEEITKEKVDLLFNAFSRDLIPPEHQEQILFDTYPGPEDIDFNPFDQKHLESFRQILEGLQICFDEGDFQSITADELFDSYSELLDAYLKDIRSSEGFIDSLLAAMQELEPDRVNETYLTTIYKVHEQNDTLIFPNSAYKLMIHSILETGTKAQKESLMSLLMLDNADETEDAWQEEAVEYNRPLTYAFFDIYHDLQVMQDPATKEGFLASFIENQDIDIDQLIIELRDTHEAVRVLNELEQEHRDDVGLIGRNDIDRFSFLDIISQEALETGSQSTPLFFKLQDWFSQARDPLFVENYGEASLTFCRKYLP